MFKFNGKHLCWSCRFHINKVYPGTRLFIPIIIAIGRYKNKIGIKVTLDPVFTHNHKNRGRLFWLSDKLDFQSGRRSPINCIKAAIESRCFEYVYQEMIAFLKDEEVPIHPCLELHALKSQLLLQFEKRLPGDIWL